MLPFTNNNVPINHHMPLIAPVQYLYQYYQVSTEIARLASLSASSFPIDANVAW